MYDIERENKILEILKEKHTVSVNSLADLVYCSGATVRRDLSRMEKKGLVCRTFGAVSLASVSARTETSFELRENVSITEKKLICQKAANLIHGSSTIFIDSSTTLLHIVPLLNNFQNLLIITNGLRIATEIILNTNHQVIVIGGNLQPHTNSILGVTALKQATQYHADFCLFSCAGYSVENGLTESSSDSAEIKKAMIQNANTTICVFDNAKVGRSATFKICDADDVNFIVTNKKMDPEIASHIKKANIQYCN